MNTIILFSLLSLNLDEQRKFVLKKLNEFGIVKSSLKETIADQVKLLVKVMKTEPADIFVHLGLGSSACRVKSMWSSVTSLQFDLDDPLVHHIYQAMDKIINSNTLVGVFIVI